MRPDTGEQARDRYYTVKEASRDYFQGKVSPREVYALYSSGDLLGFRVGTGKGKILIYASSLDAYRLGRENGRRPAAPPPPAPALPPPDKTRRCGEAPLVRLDRLPG